MTDDRNSNCLAGCNAFCDISEELSICTPHRCFSGCEMDEPVCQKILNFLATGQVMIVQYGLPRTAQYQFGIILRSDLDLIGWPRFRYCKASAATSRIPISEFYPVLDQHLPDSWFIGRIRTFYRKSRDDFRLVAMLPWIALCLLLKGIEYGEVTQQSGRIESGGRPYP